MTIENRLIPDQEQEAAAFLNTLTPADRENVLRIIDIIDAQARKVEDHPLDYSDLSAIFGAYVIGGQVNKEAPRPDIDILVMTNARWHDMYKSYKHGQPEDFSWKTKFEPVLTDLANHFGNNGFDVVIPSVIPDEYFQGADPRVMLRLLPQEQIFASRIDIIYISGAYGDHPIRSFEDFYQKDTAEDRGIGRVALTEVLVTKEILRMRL